MKLGIENKILIPFLILVIVPVVVVGITSYTGSYQLILEDKKMELQRDIDMITQTFQWIEKDVERGSITSEEGQERAQNYLYSIKDDNVLIINKDNEVIYNSNDIALTEDTLSQIKTTPSGEVEQDDKLLMYSPFRKWDWTIVSQTDISDLTNPLLEIQKYTLLVAIIAAIIAVELTILIAYHISKPIKKLADICNSMSIDHFEQKVLKRQDEVGMLANSFYNMMVKLKSNTEELIRVKKHNEDILRSTTTGIITINNNKEVMSINRSAEKLLTPKLHPELLATLQETLQNQEPIQNNVISVMDCEEEERYIESNTSVLKNEKDEVTGALCSFNDITQRKEIENRIVKIDRLSSLGEMAAGVAHEIRNPLTGIKTSTEVLSKRLGKDITDSELFENIIDEINRMNKLVTEMLNFAKPSLPSLEQKNIIIPIKESISLLEEKFIKNSIEVKLNFSKETHIVEIDDNQIKQIFLNILINSIKASPAGGQVSITTKEDSSLLTITISDTGKGIQEEYIDKIFDPFFTTDSQGTGLGLSVVHKLIEQNHGNIEVLDSKPNEGTTFVITLPLVKEELSCQTRS